MDQTQQQGHVAASPTDAPSVPSGREQMHDAESTTPVRTMNGRADAPQADAEAIVEAPAIEARAIYGVDDRWDWCQVDHKLHQDADSVVSLFFDSNIKDLGDGYSELATIPISKTLNLCPTEKEDVSHLWIPVRVVVRTRKGS